MAHFAGLDVSVKETSVCVVDDAGKVILEQKAATEPADIIAVLTSLGVPFSRIGIEAGPLSQSIPGIDIPNPIPPRLTYLPGLWTELPPQRRNALPSIG